MLIIIHIKNIKSTRALAEKSSHEQFERKTSRLNHLRIFDSIVYVLIHEEKRKEVHSKFAKFSSRAQREILCDYDEHIIYRVFMKKNYKMIRVKDLRIHEDATAKDRTNLFTYEIIMIKNVTALRSVDRQVSKYR